MVTINLENCEISNDDWRVFLTKADRFKNLKRIKICK